MRTDPPQHLASPCRDCRLRQLSLVSFGFTLAYLLCALAGLSFMGLHGHSAYGALPKAPECCAALRASLVAPLWAVLLMSHLVPLWLRCWLQFWLRF